MQSFIFYIVVIFYKLVCKLFCRNNIYIFAEFIMFCIACYYSCTSTCFGTFILQHVFKVRGYNIISML